MTYNVNATMSSELKKVEGAFPIDMYVINASYTGTDYMYYVNNNQDVVGWVLDSDGNITSATTTYTAAPVGREDLGSNIEAQISGVNVVIPNVNRMIESIIQTKNYLRGCEVYLITTFSTNLPSGSAAKFIGTDPDYRANLKEKFYIDSVTSDENAVVFSGKSKFDIRKISVPGRNFSAECQWALKGRYGELECDPDNSINTASFPNCDGTLENCRERDNQSRFGGFPSIPRRGISIVR
jgi:lambda family phage minor tail protein L